MNVETETPKKPYVPRFLLDDFNFEQYGISKSDLSEEDIKSLNRTDRTSVLQLNDPANIAEKIEGRLMVKKIDNKWTLIPAYKNKYKIEIKDIIKGVAITAEDRKVLLNFKAIAKDNFLDDYNNTFRGILVVDKELRSLLLIGEKPMPKELLHTVLSEQQLKDLQTGKPFLLKGISKDGKKIARVVYRDPITGKISMEYPTSKHKAITNLTEVAQVPITGEIISENANAKGEAITENQSTKVEPAETLNGKVVKEQVVTKAQTKTELEPEVAKPIDLEVYKEKIAARKEAKQPKAKKKTSVKL